MTRYHATNRYETELAAAMNDSQLTLEVASVAGVPSTPFKVTVGSEILEVVSIAGNTLTVNARGAEGTVAAAHSLAAKVENRWTAGTYGDLWDEVESIDGDLTTHEAKKASQSVLGHVLSKIDTNGNIVLDFNEQTGTSYTLALTDINKRVDCDNANPFTLTVPTNTSVAFPIGTQILVRQKGAGKVTVTAAGGVTLSSYDSEVRTIGQNAYAGLIKDAENTWSVLGNLEAVA